jgi:putative ABC transport system ATP-binding protein
MLTAVDILRTDRESGKVLLDAPHFAVAPGQRVAVQGPSGSGKSLLLRALAWLDRLDRGQLRYRERRVHHDSVPDYRRRVVYLHQAAALDGIKVEDALKAPFRLRVHRRARYDRAQAVKTFGSLGRDTEFLDKNIRDLSGGERQIVALTRCLLLQPEMILLDEPTAALDAATTKLVEKTVCDWVAERPDQRAILWVSHDDAQAERLATRTVRVNAGRVQE